MFLFQGRPFCVTTFNRRILVGSLSLCVEHGVTANDIINLLQISCWQISQRNVVNNYSINSLNSSVESLKEFFTFYCNSSTCKYRDDLCELVVKQCTNIL